MFIDNLVMTKHFNKTGLVIVLLWKTECLQNPFLTVCEQTKPYVITYSNRNRDRLKVTLF